MENVEDEFKRKDSAMASMASRLTEARKTIVKLSSDLAEVKNEQIEQTNHYKLALQVNQ